MRTSRSSAVVGGAVAGAVVLTAAGLGGRTAARAILLVASLAAAAACGMAARRATGGPRRGWALFALAAGCWALSHALAALQEARSGLPLPLPTRVDAPSTVAIVLAVLGVLAFLDAALSSAARMRTLLDGLLISSSLLFVSWALVLEDLYRTAGDGPARVLSLAYPMGDVVMASLVLVAIGRVRPGARLPWALLGAGLGLFAVGHSAFAYLELARLDAPGGTETLCWLAGCVLVGLAALSSDSGSAPHPTEHRVGGVWGVFVPYVPVLLAAGVAVGLPRDRGIPVFLAVNAAVVLVLLLTRQVLAQLENLELARELEARVRRRTAELHRQERHFRSIARHASDVLTVIDAGGVIRYQSASVTRVLGHQPHDLVGRRLEDLLAPADRAQLSRWLPTAPPPPAPPLSVQAHLLRADGSACLAEISIANLLGDEAVRGYVLTSRDIGERSALEERLRHQALHDPLTGLANRTLFLDRLDHAAARARRNPELVAALLIDLDGFKQVNDSLGHEAGDRLLVEVARRLRDSVREGDTVARMGGDEFAVLLERADVEGPAVVAQRILYRLRAPVELDGKAIVTQASVGVAMGSTASTGADELLRHADLAMYVAKSKGKGVFEVYDPEMHVAALERVELEADLREALRKRRLHLHFQPVVEIPSGRISGVEALVRWDHPERGMIPPSEFVPLAEESGLIVDLGRWVLHEACRLGRQFQDRYPTDPPFTMAVNVASRQLSTPWLVDEVAKALATSGLDPSSLVLEITEGALMQDAGAIVAGLRALKDLGVQLAIDDFGTGWSSLSRLRSFPVDKLKIDRSFVSEITSSDDRAPIVAAVVAMAHSLGLGVVAEGVETPEQLACLHMHGCEEVQGFLLSRPVPEDVLLELLDDPGGLLGPASGAAGPLAAAEQELAGLVTEAARPGTGRPDLVQPVLAELRRVLGVDVVYLTRIGWADLSQEVVASSDWDAGITPGLRLPWVGSPCSRMLGGGPRCVEDLARDLPDHPLAASLGLASHVSVPVLSPDGTVFGTLCAADRRPAALGDSSAVLLELYGRLLVEHVAAEGRLPELLPA